MLQSIADAGEYIIDALEDGSGRWKWRWDAWIGIGVCKNRTERRWDGEGDEDERGVIKMGAGGYENINR